jgi:hypothetical protein
MSDWTLISKRAYSGVDGAIEALTMGFASQPYLYLFEHDDTGVQKAVIAYTDEGAGQKIEDGDFVDLDD